MLYDYKQRPSRQYADNFDAVFGKKTPKCNHAGTRIQSRVDPDSEETVIFAHCSSCGKQGEIRLTGAEPRRLSATEVYTELLEKMDA